MELPTQFVVSELNKVGFTATTQATQRSPSSLGKRLLELSQHQLPTGKEGVTIRNVRERRCMTRRVALIFPRRAY